MSETNSKGPAQAQMSPEMLASLGRTPTPEASAPAEPTLVPADQVKPEDIGALSIEYRDGKPVIVISGGRAIPRHIPTVRQGEDLDLTEHEIKLWIPEGVVQYTSAQETWTYE
ncbi:hypothetical protein [Kitasatospora purpeofusca]|uniref:hypothetical protein n=1 Tax=Kitasatospora purpeofusca TaxID=67352 RepID=UPI0004C1A808|nr:hypothetical protein [Kitasatospora purpeofusca]